MNLVGYFCVGKYAGIEQVKYTATGLPVPGFHRLLVDVGTPFPRKLSFRENDFETGEPTRIAEALAEMRLADGEPIAVRISFGKGEGKFVNVDATQVIRLSSLPAAEAASVNGVPAAV